MLLCMALSLAMVQISTSVLAQAPAEARVRVLPQYEDEFRRKVYVGAGVWRDVPDDQKIWRRNQKEAREGRIELGYDSTYEAMRERGTLDDAGTGLRDPKPANVLRLRF